MTGQNLSLTHAEKIINKNEISRDQHKTEQTTKLLYQVKLPPFPNVYVVRKWAQLGMVTL